MKENFKNKQLYLDASKDSLESGYLLYVSFLSIIAVLELCMIVHGFLVFGFDRWESFGYLFSYIALFAASVLTVALLVYHRRCGDGHRRLVFCMHGYCAVITLWSFFISFLDIRNGGTMIVYMTIIVCCASILFIRPWFYAVIVVPTAVALAIAAILTKSPVISSFGYIFNFLVFVFFSLLLALSQFRLKLKATVAKQKVERLSYYDQLTGTRNRYSLRRYMASVPANTVFHLGIIDIDDFKQINDTHGHNFGDECLAEVSALLCETFGEHVFRYGGDEFVVVTTFREQDIVNAIRTINELLEKHMKQTDIHISAGFYCPKSGAEQYIECFKKADTALYEAKRAGKCRTVIYREPQEKSTGGDLQ